MQCAGQGGGDGDGELAVLDSAGLGVKLVEGRGGMQAAAGDQLVEVAAGVPGAGAAARAGAGGAGDLSCGGLPLARLGGARKLAIWSGLA